MADFGELGVEGSVVSDFSMGVGDYVLNGIWGGEDEVLSGMMEW